MTVISEPRMESPSPQIVPSPARPRAWSGDRTTWAAAAIVIPISLGLALYGLVSEINLWRWEMPRAIDRAGLYLFFAAPVMAGICAWSSYRRRRDLRGLSDGVAGSDLVARSGWLSIAFAALSVHAVVVIVHVLVAVFSGASGPVTILPIVAQFLCLAAFCALGALCGGVSRSHLVAPALMIALLGANTLFAQTGFRRISQVGTGVADFVDLHFANGYLGPKVLLYLAVIALALPWRTVRWPSAVLPLRAMFAALALIGGFLIWTYSGPMLVLRPEPRVCQGTAPVVCVPRSMAKNASIVDVAVRRGVTALQEAGVTGLPAKVDVLSRAAVGVPQGTAGLLISPAEIHDGRTLRREVARAFSAAQMCDDMTSAMPPPNNVMVSRAVLDGWLQTRLGAVEDGTFPPDGVQALDRGSAAQQHAARQKLFTGIWTCSNTVSPPT